MSVLIADSGSSKTIWKVLFEGVEQFSTSTIGLNPYQIDSDRIADIVRQEVFQPLVMRNLCPQKIYFYGAGCGTLRSKEKVFWGLHKVFPIAEIVVEDDLLGAIRAVGKSVSGVVAILGTGSNAALCSDGQLLRRIPSNGVWLGDEGSGANLGKRLITAYVNEDLPNDLRINFEKSYTDRRPEILEKVYSQPFPNRYLASFAPFIKENLHHPFVAEFVRESFASFLDFVMRKFSFTASFYVVGSIAHHFSVPLQEIATEKKIHIAQIVAHPIGGLVKYHSEEA